MKLFTRLPVKNLTEIQREVLNVLPEELFKVTTIIRLTEEYHQQILNLPCIQQTLGDFGFKPYILSLQLHVTKPNITIPTHCDNGFTFSFNIPIANCNNTYVSWFETDTEPETLRVRDDPIGLTYNRFTPDSCNLIERVEIDSPYVLNVQVPHNVENLNNTTRLMLLCRLHQDINLPYMK
jgi:hypothetical protein